MLNFTLDVKKYNRGFTLIELIVTLAVAAILVTMGVPSFISTIASSRVTAASNEVVTALNLAKSTAIRSGQNAILCKRNSAGTDCNDAGSWSDGWLLFSDLDADGVVGADEIVRVHEAPEASLNLALAAGATTYNKIEFRPNGTPNIGSGGVRFCLQNSYNTQRSRAVLVTQVGRIRTEVRTGSNNCA